MTTLAPSDPSPPGRAPADDDRHPVGRRVERHRGLPNGRTVLGGVLMTVAALGAFALATAGDDDDMVAVVVADRDLRAGDVLGTDDLRLVEAHIDGAVRGLFGSVDAAAGRTMVSATDAGEFLLASATVDHQAGAAAGFEMTVAVDANRAPGALVPGEEIDVFATWNSGLTELIAVGALVLDVDEADDDLLAGADLVVRLRLTDLAQAEALVHAHAVADVTFVRPPGDRVVEVGRRYRPGTTDDGGSGD